jgi:hypothetical protein
MTKPTCEHCPEPVWARGWCAMHYQRWKKHGDPLVTLKPRDRKCSEPGCPNPHRENGYCLKHSKRMKRYGTTIDPRQRKFWAQVDRRGPSECWPWTGHLQPNGYGTFGMRGTRLAHRIAYQYVIGPIPVGLVLDHLCHTADPQCADTNECPHRRCCNPEHLEPVTQRENIARGRGGDSWGYVLQAIPIPPKVEKPTACTEDGCATGKPIYKRTLCRPCYRKWLKDPNVERPSQRTPEQRFWAKVEKTDNCWLWTASINRGTGYGQFARRHGDMVDAHRYSYELAHRPVPDGYDVHHTCHVRDCVNPAHLEAVTRSENLRLRKYRR